MLRVCKREHILNFSPLTLLDVNPKLITFSLTVDVDASFLKRYRDRPTGMFEIEDHGKMTVTVIGYGWSRSR